MHREVSVQDGQYRLNFVALGMWWNPREWAAGIEKQGQRLDVLHKKAELLALGVLALQDLIGLQKTPHSCCQAIKVTRFVSVLLCM